MGLEGNDSFQRTYPDGSSLVAWAEEWRGEPHLHVQWRDASGKPAHQPLRLGLHIASSSLEQLAAFAREAVFENDKQP